VKLAQLKAWMKAKHFSASERVRLMSLFSANHQSSSFYDGACVHTKDRKTKGTEKRLQFVCLTWRFYPELSTMSSIRD
jgi:hypothetical protein